MANSFTIKLDEKKSKEVEIVENKSPIVVRVEAALTRLHALKSHRLVKYWKLREEYAQRLPVVKTEDGMTDYGMNTFFAIVNSKAADILTNTPKYDFIAMDDDAKAYKRIRELHWQYVWETSRTSRSVVRIIYDALKYGSGFGEEIIEDKRRTASIPKITGDAIEYEVKQISEYSGCKLNHIPFAQVYLNGTHIENTTEAIILKYWDRDEFLHTYGNLAEFSNCTDDKIPKGKYYYVSQGSATLSIGTPSANTDRAQSTIENNNTVTVLTYYNKYRDEYIVLANGVWINPIPRKNDKGENVQDAIQPIPYEHKEIPIVQYVDHMLDDDIYGMGEGDITERSRQLKNDVRSLHIEGIKAQGGIIIVDPNSDYDETIMKLGFRQVARMEKDGISFFTPSINLNSLENLERKVEEDLIVETGVDFKSQLFGPSETAARTQGRTAAAKKRINLNIKENAFTFYERLARLRMSNISTYYSDKEDTFPVKGLEISKDGKIEHIQNGYGTFTIVPENFKGKYAMIPVVDSLVGDSSQEQKQKYLETLQLFLNMRGKDGTQLFDPRLLVEAGRGIIDGAIDIDKVLGKAPDSKSVEDILAEAGIDNPTQMPPNEQGGIPPAQQSGAPILLGSSPNQ